MRKKTIVAVAVLAVGIAAALLFRKDGSRAASPPESAKGAGYEPVERRVQPRTGATGKSTARSPANQSFRVPTAAASHYPESNSAAPEMSASYQRTFSSLLNPPPESQAVPDGDSAAANGDSPDEVVPTSDDAAPRMHKIVDGDTLIKLAQLYLGSSERYLEIYELNRPLLSSPDLLPIGAVLEIPARQQKVAAGSQSDAGVEQELRLVPLLKNPLRGAKK